MKVPNMKFCANLSFMFHEGTLLERYKLAKQTGFSAVESGFPLGHSITDVVKAKTEAGVQQVLLNIHTGDVTKGELGCAAVPGQEEKFQTSLELTIKYAKALKCKKIHVMAGKLENINNLNADAYIQNIKFAARRFGEENLIGLIEPINNYSVPGYYLNSYEQAVKVLQEVNSPNMRLMLDIFHLQHIRGNITRSIKEFLPYIGHVQVAQVPDRHEPNTTGEINYKYVLNYLAKVGYDDWVGLEYFPKSDTVSGLSWIKEFGFNWGNELQCCLVDQSN